ncbi:hypothetical protein HORIV_62570 [Vreelandella olivaria]|uniref:Uncharacterized protein n=1 Tax=Vreelandella olivaria TaxID=390919 RepID=A0ABN5XB54_9GAMM|nr:hypothetical protein HORIV_62570 [Halomonas olivaria]
MIPVDQNSGWLLSLPLFHIGGYAIPFRVFLAGGRVILDEAPHSLAERLEQQAISHLSLVPTQLWRLLKAGFTLSAPNCASYCWAVRRFLRRWWRR